MSPSVSGTASSVVLYAFGKRKPVWSAKERREAERDRDDAAIDARL